MEEGAAGLLERWLRREERGGASKEMSGEGGGREESSGRGKRGRQSREKLSLGDKEEGHGEE